MLGGTVGGGSRVDLLRQLFEFHSHVSQLLIQLFLYVIRSYTWILVSLGHFSCVFGERNSLVELVDLRLVLLRTWVLSYCHVA